MNADQIASDVAERVRELVAEAERRAAQIVADAEQQASRIRADAESESEARLHAVRAAVDELQAKLNGRPAAPAAEVEPGPVTVPEPEPPLVPEPTPEPAPEPGPVTVPEPTPPPDEGTPPQPLGESLAGLASAGRPSESRSGDATSARLVAMNMALDGASREEIEGHLAETYALADAGAIVDDVLALAAK